MKTLRAVFAACLILLLALAGDPLPARAEDPPPARSAEERAMEEAIAILGWPDTISRSPMYMLGPGDETIYTLWPPNAAAIGYLTRSKVTADNGGSQEAGTIAYARIMALGEEGGRYYLDKLVENGFPATSYEGRPAVALRTGDEICGAGGLLGYVEGLVREWLAKAFGEDIMGDECPTASSGFIAWSCGSHTFMARDDSGGGGEDAIAAALYRAAEDQGLCDMGDTLVILAGTDDVAGRRPIGDFQTLAQNANSYLGQNTYGDTALVFTFLDADGSDGSQDWYNVGGQMADYAGKEQDFAIAALQKAYEAGAPREELELGRVMVIYAGPSQQAAGGSAAAPLSSLAVMPANGRWHEIRVGPPESPSTVYVGTLIVVAEEDGLGVWVHEIGHSLYSRHLLHGKWNRISDRYNYQQPWGQFGQVGYWGLMGTGAWWGDPSASNPVHMTAFTKEGAGWLTYQDAEVGQQYTLTAIENQDGAHTALRIDDPLTANPDWFYVLEARQGGGWYGAPTDGVVLYQVTRSAAAGANYAVNNLSPQAAPWSGTGPDGTQYIMPTLHGAGAGGTTVFQSPSRHLQFVLHSESTAGGYSAVVSVEPYTATQLVGAVMAPIVAPGPGAPVTATVNYEGPLPDVDLHAYDAEGRHVGWDPATGEYEREIPGAVASGDLRNDAEWIYVPEGTEVHFEVTAVKTEQFLAANPAYRDEAPPHEFAVSYGRFAADGQYTVAEGGRGKISAGEVAQLPSADDPGLKYRPAPSPHYGRNWPADWPLWGLGAAILVMGLVGWIVALVRR